MQFSSVRVRRAANLTLLLLGNVLYALTVKLFLLPAQLISCGTNGIALVVHHFFGIPMTAFILVFNLAMLAVGWCLLGKKFALTTIFSSLFYPIALEVLNRVLGDIQVTQDLLMNTIFSGLGLGVSLGLVLRSGASTGGMDIPPLILNRWFHIPVSASLWVFDFLILLTQLSFHTPEDLLYGILLILIISFFLNRVLLLGSSRTEVKIVSEQAETIRQVILSQVDRGVTVLHGEGGYLRNSTEVLLSVVSNHEYPKLERLARSIDPDCFLIVSRVTEVWGRGFSRSKKAD